MTTIFNCADCGKAIKKNSREHDECWTNMDKDDDLWYCGDCKCDHMDEDEEECDCCGENFAKLNTAEDAEGEKENYCDECWKLKIEDGCVWKENGVWVC